MGSVPSTPEGTDDPWWPIENQNFSLQSPLLNVVEMNRQGQNVVATDETDQNCGISEVNENGEISEVKQSGEVGDVCSVDDLSSESENPSDGNRDPCRERSQSVEGKEQTLEEFKEELKIKRERRQCAIANLRDEITNLRQQLAEERNLNSRLKQGCNCSSSLVADTGETDETEDSSSGCTQSDETEPAQSNSSNVTLRRQLANVQLSLQVANSEILSLQAELSVRQKQAETLKEVNTVSKQMIQIREDQLNQLRVKLKEIEDSLAERELALMSDTLRQEYDRQLANIRNLRALYEERSRVSAAERENLNRQLDTKRAELETEIEKSSNLEDRIATLEKDLQSTTDELISTKQELSEYKNENRELHEEMKVINQLFSQLLMGFNGGNDINIDKLSNMLEDNRDLLNDITNREVCKEGAAALPKLLFDLVTQAEEDVTTSGCSNVVNPVMSNDEKSATKSNVTTAQEICHNLPKVWKVLIELLNHQKAEQVTFAENGESEDCYNSVQTPTGPQLVLSVSKTYIKLKDLILEKKFLQKETNKLKNLNNHLEHRLSQQEKRLGAVSVELNKTWNLVGKMQRQHRQLHTHEQVLRYQLQQKRRMLNELKDELEYCRRKWALAREKNNESQSQWNNLRLEFSSRKRQDVNNSAESGYSDEPLSDEENSDSELAKLKNVQVIKEQLLTQSSKKLLRVHSVSPTRTENSLNKKRDLSAPPVSTFLTEVFQTTSEIVPSIVDLQPSVASKKVDVSNLKYAARTSVVEPKTANKVVVKNISSERASGSGVKPKCVDDVRPRLSRELRKKVVKIKEKKKGEETLEEMFFRLSGQEPPPPSESEQECVNESNENEEIATDLEVVADNCEEIQEALQLPANDEVTIAEDITNIILSEGDEERRAQRAARFQRLEEQCQQLMKQVISNSTRGDELNLHLDKVQRRYTPTRESSKSVDKCDEEGAAGGCTSEAPLKQDVDYLSQREQEYTSRRAERLKRLEEECKEFLNKQNQSKIRANEMNNKLDKLHQRYGSHENTPESSSVADNGESKAVELRTEEEECVSKRVERLKRLEEESAELLKRMAQSADRASNIESDLDALLEKCGEEQDDVLVGEENSETVEESLTLQSDNSDSHNADVG